MRRKGSRAFGFGVLLVESGKSSSVTSDSGELGSSASIEV